MRYGSYGYEPEVEYLFGFPRALVPGGVVMNVRLGDRIGTHGVDAAGKRALHQQVGLLSSALEHAVPEQMFVTAENPGEAISAVKALQKATAQGQRVYHVTQANQATALSDIRHDAATMAEIRAALAVGREVITHTDAVSVPGWSGAGYVILDPETGVGAYKIAGGGNGGGIYWGTVLFLSTVISIALATGNVWLALFAAIAYTDFLKRVKAIAHNHDLSPQESYAQMNAAAFLAVTATLADVALPLLGTIGKTMAGFLAGVVFVFDLVWYDDCFFC